MKKIIALTLLCLLLCAMSVTAFAATVTFQDDYGQIKVFADIADGQFTLPSYADCGFTQPSGARFVGWQIGTNQVYYKPDSKITVSGEMNIRAYYVSPQQDIVEVKYVSNKYNDNNLVGYYPVVRNTPMDLTYPFYCGFGDINASSFEFDHWLVEGEFFEGYGDLGEEWGWLFARAIAAEIFREEMSPEEVITVQGDVTITAVWKGENNNGGGETGGGETGGGETGGIDAADMPRTGDNSLSIDFLFVVMLVSLCGLRLMAKKRIN